ncbi:MAG TPA: murein biosynthesis integral membrane protein MurJ, partial [Candidatus Cloacimonadota bacterium]|nr:murein biosynthesis integral membrane protein MurJ [Candidatus Cloacimonadota bacterium]
GMIAFLGLFLLISKASTMEEQVFFWSYGVLIGGVMQTVVNLPLLRKIGYQIKLNISLQGEALAAVWQRLIPGAVGIAVRQINLIVDTILASLLATGSIAALGYGNRLMQLPMGIFGVAAGVAVLPLFSRFVAEKDWNGFRESLRFSTISLSFIMLPITAIIAGLGKDIIRLFFMRGAFDIKSVNMTYSALLCYSLGILFYSLNRLIIPAFYANKDTKTPVKVSILIVFINVILNLILMQVLQLAGLALATSLSAAVQFFILRDLMNKRIGFIKFPNVIKPMLKLLSLSLLVYLGLFFANHFLIPANIWQLLSKIILLTVASFVFMAVGSSLLKVKYSKEIKQRIMTKFLSK